MQIHRSNNIVPKTLPGVNYYEVLATCSSTVLMYLTCQKILSSRQYGMCSLIL